MEISYLASHIRGIIIRELHRDIKLLSGLVPRDLIFKARIISRSSNVSAGPELEILRLGSPSVKRHSIQISCKINIDPVAHLCRAIRNGYFLRRALKVCLNSLLHLFISHFCLFHLRHFQTFILGHCHIFIGYFPAAASRKCTGQSCGKHDCDDLLFHFFFSL